MSVRPFLESAARVWQTLRYSVRSRPWPLELPVVVQFPINDICDSKCQMCNIWQQKLDRQVSVEDGRKVFSDPLFRRVRAIGLNGGEPTLRRDLADIGRMLFETVPNLKSLSLITNGLHSDRAIERIDSLADAVSACGGRLDVMVSIDGVGDVHDRVRGVPGNFEHAVRVLDHVLAHRSKMTARVGCTVITENVYNVHELLDFCINRGAYIKFRLGVPNRRLYNLPAPPAKQIGKRVWIDTHPFGLDEEQRWHFAQFLYGLNSGYESSLQQRQFYRSLAGQLVLGQPRRAGCDWQHRGVTVSSRGEILYCAVQSDILGSGLTQSPQDLYFGHREHLQSIVKDKCASCAHDYVGPPGGRDQAALLLDDLLRKCGTDLRRASVSRPARMLASLKKTSVDRIRFDSSRRRFAQNMAVAGGSSSARKGVVICGWYGTETLGDRAILGAIVEAIHELSPGEQITIASLNPFYTRLTVAQMPELAGCDVIAAERAIETIDQQRGLVFGGGPLMAIREMALMEGLFLRARSAGVPGIIAGCGVGPLGSASFNRSIVGLLSAASRRIFRDAESRDAAAKLLGYSDAADLVCEDPAASWVVKHRPARLPPPASPTLALGLRDWPYTQYAPELNPRKGETIQKRFEDTVVQSLDQVLAETPGLRLAPIPFCAHRVGGDDRLLYWRLVRRSSRIRAASDLSMISREPSPEALLSRMASMDAMLAMRFHSLVFASALSLPTVAIDYTMGAGKTHALGKRLGHPMLRIDSIEPDVLTSALIAALKRTTGVDVPPLTFRDIFERAWLDCGLGKPAPSIQ
jgi:MoaA/NifB/PqqE/SkfB family radical SAM enzyme/polysaccharide pyruvyl transferase WcaK-like protein